MGLRSKALFLTIGWLLALGARLAADGLPVPEGLQFHAVPGGLTLSWQGVEGAGLYRVAIFDEPEADGKRPLLAAVWVHGTQYIYGKTVTVPKAGKYPSTKPLPLPAHRRLRVMVAAAASDGSDKGDWAGLDVETAAPRPRPLRMTRLPRPALHRAPWSAPARARPRARPPKTLSWKCRARKNSSSRRMRPSWTWMIRRPLPAAQCWARPRQARQCPVRPLRRVPLRATRRQRHPAAQPASCQPRLC